MIHLDLADGTSRWLTRDQLKAEFPEFYEAMYAPRQFNEGGEKIKKLRKKYELTVLELAHASGIKLGDLSAIETGRVEATREQIEAIQLAVQQTALRRFNHAFKAF